MNNTNYNWNKIEKAKKLVAYLTLNTTAIQILDPQCYMTFRDQNYCLVNTVGTTKNLVENRFSTSFIFASAHPSLERKRKEDRITR